MGYETNYADEFNTYVRPQDQIPCTQREHRLRSYDSSFPSFLFCSLCFSFHGFSGDGYTGVLYHANNRDIIIAPL